MGINSAYIEQCPPEILRYLTSFLDLPDFWALAQVSKRVREALKKPSMAIHRSQSWKNLTKEFCIFTKNPQIKKIKNIERRALPLFYENKHLKTVLKRDKGLVIFDLDIDLQKNAETQNLVPKVFEFKNENLLALSNDGYSTEIWEKSLPSQWTQTRLFDSTSSSPICKLVFFPESLMANANTTYDLLQIYEDGGGTFFNIQNGEHFDGKFISKCMIFNRLEGYEYKDNVVKKLALQKKDIINNFLIFKNSISCLHQHPDETELLYIGFENGLIESWDVLNKKIVKTFLGHMDKITCLATSPDGNLLVSASKDSTIKVWTKNAQCLNTLSFKEKDVEPTTLKVSDQAIACVASFQKAAVSSLSHFNFNAER